MKKKATLLHKSKLVLNSSRVREFAIWKIPQSNSYPEGIKYRLALIDPIWKKVILLFDNHAPKGHHYHLKNGKEYQYSFTSIAKLVEDYLRLEDIEERNNENSEN